jgi:hypothetical protein
MTLKITRTSAGYLVAVDPPHGTAWTSDAPLTPWSVLDELESRGVHSTDASDAMDAADWEWAQAGRDPSPTWTEVHDAQVRRSRDIHGRWLSEITK